MAIREAWRARQKVFAIRPDLFKFRPLAVVGAKPANNHLLAWRNHLQVSEHNIRLCSTVSSSALSELPRRRHRNCPARFRVEIQSASEHGATNSGTFTTDVSDTLPLEILLAEQVRDTGGKRKIGDGLPSQT